MTNKTRSQSACERLLAFVADHLLLLSILGLGVSLTASVAGYLFGAYQMSILLAFIAAGIVLSTVVQTRQTAVTHSPIPSKPLLVVQILLVSASVLSLALAGLPVLRPPAFFIIISILLGTISVEIHSSTLSRVKTGFILMKMATATYLYFATYFVGRATAGGDQALHMYGRAGGLLEGGFLIDMMGYNNKPLYHVLWVSIANLFGVDIETAKWGMLLLPALGGLFVFILARLVTNSRGALSAALLAQATPILLRVKLQTEAVVFPIIVPLMLFLLLRKRYSTKNLLLLNILFVFLLNVHFYYPTIVLTLFGINAILLLTVRPAFSDLFHSTIFHLTLSFGILWFSKMLLTTRNFGKAINSIIGLLNTTPSNLAVQPEHLTGKLAINEFFMIHAAEFFILSFAVVGILVWMENLRVDSKRFALLSIFGVFSLYSAYGIVLEASIGNIKWAYFLRHSFLLSVFLAIFGGIGLSKLAHSVRWRHVMVGIVFVSVVTIGATSLGSSQTNKFDPIIHHGDNRSPRVVTHEQIATLDNFVSYLPADPLIVSDKTVASDKNLIPVGERTRRAQFADVRVFNRPSLDRLSADYDYLVVNTLTLEHGYLFGKIRGLKFDRARLQRHRTNTSKVWSSGQIEVYYRDSGQYNEG